ncbi:glucosyltransferase domain-containing protein [Yersinia kristensenii]|uniref:glucosyltransferase domain-containing protein n=1 Tax=Yersinia kristensenii TaxID=28152 RepID=UPI001C610452|nr:glucosyltransferase domain-containing protein [Yersinia kristensenii]MBW5826525.1 glucosyltransferase domain-containing protein [Yersinia kristensenii]
MFNRNHYIPFLIIGLFYLPIILNNNLYVDDIFRAQTGFDGWSVAGRPLSDAVIHILMMSSGDLIGYGQLGQILSIIALSITAIYFTKSVFGTEEKLGYILSCGFALSPFYLENISYQYDSITMTISLCASVFAACQCTKREKSSFFFSVLCIVIACSLYQTAINSFIGISCVVIIINSAINKSSAKSMICSISLAALSLLVGLIIYTLIIKTVVPMTGSRGNEFHIDRYMIDFFITRVNRFYDTAIKSVSFAYSLAALSLIFIVIIIKVLKKDIKASSSLVVVPCIIVIFLCPIGMLIAFKEPGITSRMMMGSSALTCLLFSLIYIAPIKKSYIYILTISFAFPLFVISYSYAYATKEQRAYDRSNVTMSLNDTRNSSGYNNKSYIVFSGRLPVAPLSKITADSIPVISMMLVPAYDWTASMIAQSLDVPDVRFNFARKEQKTIVSDVCLNKEQPFAETNAYSVYHNKESNGFLVWLKGGKKSPC